MLIVRFCGGLGNQMFEYAFCVKLKNLFPNCEIKTDVREYRVTKYHHGYEMDTVFKQRQFFKEATWGEIKQLRGDFPIVIGWPLSKVTEPIRIILNKHFTSLKEENILEEEYVDIESLEEIYREKFQRKDYYLHGCWTGINHYIDELEILKKDLEFPVFTEPENLKVKEKMEKTESVSVHIRRGDYIGTAFDVLDLNYYHKAIDYIKKHVVNPVFYFFSDDVNYIKENFTFLDNVKIVDWNSGEKSWRDMQLMSCCRHNIIANSTFSQWSAILNRNPKKLVVYPGKERSDLKTEQVRLPGWHKIEV